MLMIRPLERVAQLGREDLHVPREHDELDVVLLDHLEHALLERQLLAGRGHRVRLERHAVERGELGEVGMVAQHERDVDRQLAGALAEQQVVEAVAGLRDQHEGAQRAADDVELPRHPVALGHGRERRLELLARWPPTRPAGA